MRTKSCTPSAMGKYVPVREFHSRLSELLSDVVDRRDHILVTRNGKPAAALVPIDEYQALEKSAEILCDDQNRPRRARARRNHHPRATPRRTRRTPARPLAQHGRVVL